MVKNGELRKRIRFYIFTYIVVYPIVLTYNDFEILSISPINLVSLVVAFIISGGIYYGSKPSGFFNYRKEMFTESFLCMFIFIIIMSILTILQYYYGINSKFFVGM